jgi:hypothetical protein
LSSVRFDLNTEYSKLQWWQKGVSVIASALMVLFCRNYDTSLKSWVGRFRVVDDKTITPIQKKADQIATPLKPSSLSAEEKQNIIHEVFLKAPEGRIHKILNVDKEVSVKVYSLMINYKMFNKNAVSPFDSEEDLEKALKEFIRLNSKPPVSVNSVKLPGVETNKFRVGSENLTAYDTLGDGSCGIHAMIGQFIEGKYRVPNIEEVRSDFFESMKTMYLRDRSKQDHPVNISLQNLFLNIDNEPEVYSPLKVLRNRFYDPTTYKNASNAEKDARFNRFVENREVVDLYFNILKQRGILIDQFQLFVAASFFNVNLVLWQKDWSEDKIVSSDSDIYKGFIPKPNPSAPQVHIYFDREAIHYERAQLTLP